MASSIDDAMDNAVVSSMNGSMDDTMASSTDGSIDDAMVSSMDNAMASSTDDTMDHPCIPAIPWHVPCVPMKYSEDAYHRSKHRVTERAT